MSDQELTATDPLSLVEQERLQHYESVIQESLEDATKFMQALYDIYEQKLWRGQYASFQDYVTERWKFSISKAYRWIEKLNNDRLLNSPGAKNGSPASMKAHRIMEGLSDEEKVKVNDRAHELAEGGDVTNEHYRQAKAEIPGYDPVITTRRMATVTCPACGHVFEELVKSTD